MFPKFPNSQKTSCCILWFYCLTYITYYFVKVLLVGIFFFDGSHTARVNMAYIRMSYMLPIIKYTKDLF